MMVDFQDKVEVELRVTAGLSKLETTKMTIPRKALMDTVSLVKIMRYQKNLDLNSLKKLETGAYIYSAIKLEPNEVCDIISYVSSETFTHL